MSNRPIIFLAFANNRTDPAHFLDKLAEEERRLRETLGGAAELCDVVYDETATADEILALFQKHRDRIAIFHFAGHANSYQLLLETADGQPAAANASGFAAFLGQQTGLELVFLNGCSTQGQVEKLLAANVPAVIATDKKIKDDVATDFAALFYGGLATGASIRSAFEQAKDGIHFKKGDKTRDLFEEDVAEATPASAIPWDLHALPDHDPSAWTLWEAAGNPLFGLPPLSEQPLPPAPFPGLAPYAADQAELFFGRGTEIRRLVDWAVSDKTPPILLLHGQTGVGKSSLLDAGLRPRLTARQQVCYLRRDPALSLTGTLLAALTSLTENGQGESLPPDLAARWRATEAQSGRFLTVILDQADEVLTRPATGQANEYDALAAALAPLFADPAQPSPGKLILAFRQEALAPIRQALTDHGLAAQCLDRPLDRLDRAGIMESVRGPTQNARLRATYRVTIDRELPALVAEDLTTDDKSPIAPVLQVLLGEMWAQVVSQGEPRSLGCSLYNAVRQDGYGLRAFLTNQLSVLQTAAPAIVESGWAVDLLAEHATSLGAARARSLDELRATYPQHADALPGLIQQCQDLYLLTDLRPTPYGELAGQDHVHRLAHDTLALVVRQRYGESDLPGQRARRILEARAPAWADEGDGDAQQPIEPSVRSPLDDSDLAAAEAGATGMRAWTDAERRLVDASRTARDRRQRTRKIVISSFIGLGIIIAIAAVFATWQANVATQAKITAVARGVEAQEQRDLARAESTRALKAEGEAVVQRDNAVTAQANEAAARQQADLSAKAEATAAADAKQKQAVAEREARRALAENLAGQSQLLIRAENQPGDLALILALDAVLTDPVFNANQALRFALNTVRWRLTFKPAGSRSVGSSVNSVAFSPNGLHIVSAGSNGDIRLWRASDLELQQRLHAHAYWVRPVAFSPDGAQFVSGGDDTMRLWDVATGQPMAQLDGHAGGVFSVAFSPDGAQIVSGGADSTVRLWDVATGKQVAQLDGHTGGVLSVAFSPDGALIASGSADSTVRLWDVATGKQVAQLDGHADGVWSVAFSPDGALIASGSADSTVRLWDVATGKQVAQLDGHAGGVNSVAFSPDGTHIVSGGDDSTVHLWDVATGQQVVHLDGHAGGVNSVGFSPDGTQVISGGADGTVRLWDVASDQQVAQLEAHAGAVNSVGFSPDGTQVVSGGADGTVRLWDVATGQQMAQLDGHAGGVWSVAFSPDGAQFVSGGADGMVRLWEVATGQQVAQLDGHGSRVLSVAFSPDGAQLASSEEGTVRLWEVATGKQMAQLDGHKGGVWSVAFSPDGTQVVSGGDDRTVRLWEVATGKQVAQLDGHAGGVNSVSFSPDGTQIVSGDADGTMRLWQVASGQPTAQLAGHADWVRSVGFSPDGAQIVSGGDDRTVRLWDAVSGQQIAQLAGHASYVYSVGFSPDGAQIVSGGADGTVLLWDAPQRALLRAVNRISRRMPILTDEERQRFGIGQEVGLPDQNELKPFMILAQALQMWERGQDLARSGDVLRAAALFQQAAQQTEEAHSLARAGNLSTAPAILYQALSINPMPAIDPEALAQRILQGQVQALSFAARSLAANPNASNVDWNALCWDGSIWNHANLMLDACQTAVKLAPDDGNIRHSRGLARALTGDMQGAIEDFEFALAQAKERGGSPYFVASRTAWVAALAAGKNPFDAAMLELLRNE